MMQIEMADAYDVLLGANTALADAVEALQVAQENLADATSTIGETTGLL